MSAVPGVSRIRPYALPCPHLIELLAVGSVASRRWLFGTSVGAAPYFAWMTVPSVQVIGFRCRKSSARTSVQ